MRVEERVDLALLRQRREQIRQHVGLSCRRAVDEGNTRGIGDGEDVGLAERQQVEALGEALRTRGSRGDLRGSARRG